MNLTRFSIQRPIGITMIVLFFIVLGLFSYYRIGVELLPSLNVAVLTTGANGVETLPIRSVWLKRITAAAGLINFVVLTAALSGCNSGLYSSGRMLYTLAKNGQAPKIFMRLSKSGVPRVGIGVTIGFLIFGVILNYLIPDSKLFLYLYSASVFPGMIAWFVLAYSQKRFRAY